MKASKSRPSRNTNNTSAEMACPELRGSGQELFSNWNSLERNAQPQARGSSAVNSFF